MTRYKYVSVHEYTSGPREGSRIIIFGKDEQSASDVLIPTPDNDVETMSRMERERVLVWRLPEPMTKDEVREFLDDEQPDEVWSALEKEGGVVDG